MSDNKYPTARVGLPVMQCSNCKHWAQETYKTYPKHFALGKCQKVKLFLDCTEWSDVDGDYRMVFTNEAKGNKAFIQGGSDYWAELITRPDFGCVQFEIEPHKDG